MHDAGRLAGSLYVTTVYATLIDNNRPLLQCITSLRIQLWHENDSLQCVNYFTLIGKNIHKTVDNKWSIYILYVGRAIEQICKRLASNFTSKGDCHCVQKPFYNWCSHAHFIGRIVIQTLPVGLVKSDCMRACMQLERVQMLHFLILLSADDDYDLLHVTTMITCASTGCFCTQAIALASRLKRWYQVTAHTELPSSADRVTVFREIFQTWLILTGFKYFNKLGVRDAVLPETGPINLLPSF